ncbi:MAG: right-handed parallel beta-helix repeat-containing protein [Candidatus Odinarchaeia archaeon]
MRNKHKFLCAALFFTLLLLPIFQFNWSSILATNGEKLSQTGNIVYSQKTGTTIFSFQVFSASDADIVVPDDYPTIQQAIDAAASGNVIYVRAGTYEEDLTITKSLTIIGENMQTTIIKGTGTSSTITVTADSVTITGFTITGATSAPNSGVYLNGASDCSITGNNITGNANGVSLSSATNNVISENIITGNEQDGVHIGSSSNDNTVSNNTMYDNTYGVFVVGASNNVISENNITDNNADGVYLLSSSINNTISNNTITNNAWRGLQIYSSHNNTISGNTLEYNRKSFQICYHP